AEAVVPPDDVLEDLVVPSVVRRVDDPLVLPAAPRMCSGRRKRDVEAAGELGQLLTPLDHRAGGLREVVAPARLGLSLGHDQLAAEMLVELGARGRLLQLLEAVRQLQGLGIEERELLFDRDREVAALLERLASRSDLLVRAQTLRVAHGASLSEALTAAPRRSTSSSAPPPPGERPSRARGASPLAGRAGVGASCRDRPWSSRGRGAGADTRPPRRPRSRPTPSVGRRAAARRRQRLPQRPCRRPRERSRARRRRPPAAAGARGVGARAAR